MLEPLVPTESSQDKGNFPVRSRPEENYPEWKPALTVHIINQNKQEKDHVDLPNNRQSLVSLM